MTTANEATLISFPQSDGEGNTRNDHPLGSSVAKADMAVDKAWEKLRGHPIADWLFYAASRLGDFSLLWHLLAVARGLTSKYGAKETARLVTVLTAESALVNGAVKSLFRRERPSSLEERPHHLRQPLTSSFPSGHASAAFLAAALLSEDSKLKPLWYVLAGTVSASRIHTRIHHASDVAAGAAIGAILGRIVRRSLPLH